MRNDCGIILRLFAEGGWVVYRKLLSVYVWLGPGSTFVVLVKKSAQVIKHWHIEVATFAILLLVLRLVAIWTTRSPSIAEWNQQPPSRNPPRDGHP